MKAASLPRERPLLYSAPMVRAILAGAKTQTRRVIFKDGKPEHHMPWRVSGTHWQDGDDPLRCPHGDVGDRLWVRETLHQEFTVVDVDTPNGCLAVYSADCSPVERDGRPACYEWERQTLPSIHMPRWACRIVLEITAVRAEPLQAITDADIVAEGVAEYARSKGLDPARLKLRAAWIDLWDAINGGRDGGRYAWDRNPWTWVVEFRRTEGGGHHG